jgi:phytoene dehydrogenase-like protein
VSDAVVIGSGPNGLVAANMLADAGWEVHVLEAEPDPGGAVRSGELTLPGYVHDRFSAFYPLGVASPHMRALRLDEHGLRWRRSEIAVAHPSQDGTVAALSLDEDETAASLEAFAPGDGDAWHRYMAHFDRAGFAFVRALLSPFPPVRAGAGLAHALGPTGLLDFARLGMLPVRRHAVEAFDGAGAARLLAGNALHADVAPETPGGALFAWVLVGLGQRMGWPVPEGGSGELTAALVRRLESRGGRVTCGARVGKVIVRGGRAVGVCTTDGREVDARRAVLADTGAPQLFLDLLDREHVPDTLLRALRRFQYDNSTVKVDWALDAPIPWSWPEVRRAGTVHVVDSVDQLTQETAAMAAGLIPARPFVIVGQYAAVDPSRAPAGADTAWGYTHVPQEIRGDAGPDGLRGDWSDPAERERFADRVEEQIEPLAPGFRASIKGRHIAMPNDLERENANLVGGAINGGTAQIHQQLVFRPVPGLGRSETPVAGLFLASASAHPGGGVHGACGAIAARAALRERGPLKRVAAKVTRGG